MKHGLKQEIKRGLSVLMAASMVASSALPVMAEEVVEETVEVDVVSEDVAEEAEDVAEEAEDVAEDVVVDVAEEEAAEEVTEEVVVEDAADAVVDYDGPIVDADDDHDFAATEMSTYTLAVDRSYYEDGSNGTFVIHYTCGVPGCTDSTHTVKRAYWTALPTETGWDKGKVVTIDKMRMKVVLEEKIEMDCTTNTEGYEEYVLYSVNNNFEKQTKLATDQVNIPVTHVPGDNFVVEEMGTCTKDAKVSFNCAKCNKKLENYSIPAPGHDYKVSYTVTGNKLWAADGTSLTAHVDCVGCDDDYVGTNYAKCFTPCKASKDVTFTGDTIRESQYKAPTCTTAGSVVKYVAGFMQEKALESLIDYKPARDNLEGITDQNKKFSIKALGHTNVKLYEDPKAVTMSLDQYPGLEWNGYDWGDVKWGCERGCNGTLTFADFDLKNEDIPKKRYTIITKQIVKPTCTQKGIYELSIVGKLDDGQIVNGTRVCKITSIELGAHQYSAADAAKATCAKPYTGSWVCTECGFTVTNEPIYVEHQIALKSNVIKPATCMNDGVREGYCVVCKKDVQELLIKQDDEYSKATDFGKTQLDEQYETLMKDLAIPKLQHEYKIVDEAWDNGSWVTLEAKCVNGCENYVEQILPVEVVYDKYPTYDQTGTRHYTATMDFYEEEDGQHIVLPWESNKVTVKATGVADKVTLSIADKTVEYTGDRQHVNVAASVVDGGNNVIANVAKEVEVKYYRDAAYTQQFSGEPYTAGTYYVKATLAATKSHEGATAEAVLVINKKNPTVTVKQSATTVKNTKKNTVNLTVSIKDVIGQKGKVTYVADKGITVSKKGIVTIKKNTKKGTYKVKVNVKATTNYNGVTKTIKIKVK